MLHTMSHATSDAFGPDAILQQLKETGFRITKTRRAVVDIFCSTGRPLSVEELLDFLAERGHEVNKTTVYRELEFLEAQHIVREVQLGQDRKRFELTHGPHHHHIRCLHCGMITDVSIPNELKTATGHIENQTGFTVLDHSLEFVGLCKNCKK